MRASEITFTGTGGEQLVGTLDLPPKAPEGYALMAHCFTGGRNHPATRRVSKALCERGLAVLRFDFTGFGESGGEFAESTFSSNVADIVLAADWLRAEHGAPSLLVGHSLGGAAVIAAAPQIPEIAAVATIGAPDDPGHVAHLFASVIPQVEREGRAEVRLGGQRVVVGREFLEDIRSVDIDGAAARLGCPLLLMHSPQDTIVGLSNAEGLYRAAKHPKSFICLDGADHLLTGADDAHRAAQLIAAWADPYLPSFTPEVD